MLDPRWTKTLIEAARLALWTSSPDPLATTPDSLLMLGGLRKPRSEAERLMLLGIVTDLRQKLVDQRRSGGPVFDQILAYIRSHSRESDLTRNKVARELTVSDSWIAHRFKKHVGVSFSKFLSDLRLADGVALLQTPGVSVKHVALTVGFRDPGSFTRALRKRGSR